MSVSHLQSIDAAYREFIPSEKGRPLDEQIYPWSLDGMKADMSEQLEERQIDPQSASNVLRMAAVEAQHVTDYLSFASAVSDEGLKQLLAQIARAEHIHHLRLITLLPKPHSPSENVLRMELALLSLYDAAADSEANATVKDAFHYMYRDHLWHAEDASFAVKDEGCDLEAITGGRNLLGGRTPFTEFVKPQDTIWGGHFDGAYSKETVSSQTLVNVDMSLAGELASWNRYECAIGNAEDARIRTHFAAFSSFEQQHIGIASSLKDPSETLLERSLVHEGVEQSNYGQMMQSDPSEKIRGLFAELYREDMEHAQLFGQIASRS